MKWLATFVMLSLSSPASSGVPFSEAGSAAIKACRAAYPAGAEQHSEHYAFVEAEEIANSRWYRNAGGENVWSSAEGDVLEQLELTFRGHRLSELRSHVSTDHVTSVIEVCFHSTGAPAVSLRTEIVHFDWVCDETGEQLVTDKIVTIEKLTELSPGGLFSVSTRLFLGAGELPQERFCGPEVFLNDLAEPSQYLAPGDSLLAGEIADMRADAPLLAP